MGFVRGIGGGMLVHRASERLIHEPPPDFVLVLVLVARLPARFAVAALAHAVHAHCLMGMLMARLRLRLRLGLLGLVGECGAGERQCACGERDVAYASHFKLLVSVG
jgi:hypothetical protein